MKTARVYENKGISQFELSKQILNNLSQFNLKPITKLVLLYLCDCYNPNKAEMFPKQSTIADKLGVSEASVIRAISELHKEGLIVSERKYTNRYKFTSKIVAQCHQDDFLCKNNMQVEKLQNESKETCKMQPAIHEQKIETNKETNIQDFRILREYAVSKGAKNINAYINALVKSGSAKEIIKNEKQKMANIKAMEANTAKVIKDLEFAKANAANVDSSFFENIRLRMQIKQ